MANDYFMCKVAQDELRDTLFFASGEIPKKEKTPQCISLTTTPFTLKIYTPRNITVNSHKCKSIHEAKLYIQNNL